MRVPIDAESEQIGAAARLRSAGNATVDADHRQLADLAECFRRAVAENNLPRATQIFEVLLTGLQAHFKREEGLLRGCAPDDRRTHITLHEEVLREMLSIRGDDFRLLRCWPQRAVDLVGHLMRRAHARDMDCAAYFREAGQLPPLLLLGLPQ